MLPYYINTIIKPNVQEIAKLIGATGKDIIFTSGATEANNMAIKGVARFYKEKKRHIVTVQTEHKCVLDSCRALESEGFEVCYHFWCRQICYVDF